MGLDGAFLSFLTAEIGAELEGTRVDKIHQPEKDEVDITFRSRAGARKLLLSANANSPRVQLTEISKENPLSAPLFCMLLRKHLSGARFLGARQPGFERIVFFDFATHNELGDDVILTLAAEIMGRRSNIVLLDEKGRILDAVKHVDETMSRERQILPGLSYERPPAQEKLDLAATPADAVAAAVHQKRDAELARALMDTVQGVSPLVCRELAFAACGDATARASALGRENWARLSRALEELRADVAAHRGTPTLVCDAATGKPLDFSFYPVRQYGDGAVIRPYPGFSSLLDAFYTERDRIDRMNQRSHDIQALLGAQIARVSRRLEAQRGELAQSRGREQMRVCGDLVSANLYRLHKGMDACRVADFYREGEPEVTVKLDPALSPAQNAQKYYREYRKLSAAESVLHEQLRQGEEELAYLDTVREELSRAQNESGLEEIREELCGEGYIKKRQGAPKGRGSAPMSFTSGDGFKILVGRNNRQNDRLTLKTADKNDIWLHTRNIPGAHVIIEAGGAPAVPDATLTQAACLAALYSRARDSAQVPVDYTLVRYVKKPAGAKPGKVIYDNFKTAFVTPDLALAERLRNGPA